MFKVKGNTTRTEGVRRRGAALLLSITATVGLTVGVAAPAHADAGNCSLAPGSAGASVCIRVDGIGTMVDNVTAGYQPGPAKVADNLCNRTYEIMFQPRDAAAPEFRSVNFAGCQWGLLYDYVDFGSLPALADRSMLCAHTKNTHIPDDGWTVWECVEMKDTGGLWGSGFGDWIGLPGDEWW